MPAGLTRYMREQGWLLRSSSCVLLQCELMPAATLAAGALGDAASAVSRHVDRLHEILHDMSPDLASHVLTDTGRESIVETGIDACHRNSVGKAQKIPPPGG